MNSNYHWQKHQVNERAQDRMRTAEVERRLKEISPRREFFLFRIVKAIFGGVTSNHKDRERVSRRDAEATQVRQPRLAK